MATDLKEDYCDFEDDDLESAEDIAEALEDKMLEENH